jgi:hypothetical protein
LIDAGTVPGIPRQLLQQLFSFAWPILMVGPGIFAGGEEWALGVSRTLRNFRQSMVSWLAGLTVGD